MICSRKNVLDLVPDQPTMDRSRREDRALLRSNPSAWPAAETWPGVSFPGRLPTCIPLPCFGQNAINLRARGAAPSTTLFPVPIGAVRHMSGSAGHLLPQEKVG